MPLSADEYVRMYEDRKREEEQSRLDRAPGEALSRQIGALYNEGTPLWHRLNPGNKKPR